MFVSCAYTNITKSDGTEISHMSLLVNTKNIEINIEKDTLEMILGNQIIDLELLKSAIDTYLGGMK
jgi:hypothetical protein